MKLVPIQVPGTVLRLRRELAWQLAALCVDGMLFFSALSFVLWNGGDPVFWKEQISPLVRLATFLNGLSVFLLGLYVGALIRASPYYRGSC